MNDYKYEETEKYFECAQCGYDIITNPRCITWGGTLDRSCEDLDKAKNIKTIFIGQNPWFNLSKYKENIYGRAFGALSETILMKYITKYNIDQSSIWITNVVQCSVIDNDTKNIVKAFKFCKKFLLNEINILKPQYIILMGKLAQKLVRKLEIDNYEIIDIPHPNALTYNPELKDVYDKLFERIARL